MGLETRPQALVGRVGVAAENDAVANEQGICCRRRQKRAASHVLVVELPLIFVHEGATLVGFGNVALLVVSFI